MSFFVLRVFEPQRHKATKKHKAMYKILSERIEYLAREIVDISVCIHKELGPGLLESVYAKCFCFELKKRNIQFSVEQHIDIFYQSELIAHNGLKIDWLIENVLS